MILFILPSIRTVAKLNQPLSVHSSETKSIWKKYQTCPPLFDLYTTANDKSWFEVRNALLYKFKIKPCLTNTWPLNSEEKVTIFYFSDFNSSSEMVCFRCTSRFLSTQHSEIFWNIQELYERYILQFRRYFTIWKFRFFNFVKFLK